jgi:hypothetical protein
MVGLPMRFTATNVSATLDATTSIMTRRIHVGMRLFNQFRNFSSRLNKGKGKVVTIQSCVESRDFRKPSLSFKWIQMTMNFTAGGTGLE